MFSVRLAKHHILFIMPLARRHLLPIRVFVHSVVLRPQEICDGIPVFFLSAPGGWDDPVEARVETFAAEEAERVADVDRRVSAGAWLDEGPVIRVGRPDLQAPLLAEEQRNASSNASCTAFP